jgi:hypothetical protein
VYSHRIGLEPEYEEKLHQILPQRFAVAYGRVLPWLETLSGLALTGGVLPMAVGGSRWQCYSASW